MKKYTDHYYLVRKLKPFLKVNANSKTIYVGEGKVIAEKAQKYVDLLVQNFGFIIQSEIEVLEYEFILISRSIGVRGKKIHFLQHKFFELSPGIKVSKIGIGVATGSNHIDKFSEPYEYSGALIYNDKKYFAFKLPESLKPLPDYEFYMLYTKDKYNVYRKILNKDGSLDYYRVLKPKFKIN